MKFYLYVNETKLVAKTMANEIKKFIVEKGAQVVDTPAAATIILSLGGDGTLLRCWRETKEFSSLIFGINCGTLGYLTEGNRDNWQEKITQIIDGKFYIEDRITLQCGKAQALNDIVFMKKGKQLLKYDISINNEFLTSYTADGLICSTPTGSTGYALSVGGAFIDPSSEVIEIIPIAPHSLMNRSIIIPADKKVNISIKNPDVEVIVDGEIVSATDFDISKGEDIMRMVKVSKESFVENISRTF